MKNKKENINMQDLTQATEKFQNTTQQKFKWQWISDDRVSNIEDGQWIFFSEVMKRSSQKKKLKEREKKNCSKFIFLKKFSCKNKKSEKILFTTKKKKVEKSQHNSTKEHQTFGSK